MSCSRLDLVQQFRLNKNINILFAGSSHVLIISGHVATSIYIYSCLRHSSLYRLWFLPAIRWLNLQPVLMTASVFLCYLSPCTKASCTVFFFFFGTGTGWWIWADNGPRRKYRQQWESYKARSVTSHMYISFLLRDLLLLLRQASSWLQSRV